MSTTCHRWWWAAALVLLAGCATPQTRADRAFDEGDYQRAFSEYKQIIDQGTDDWRVYYRAAKAATQIGNFAVAEKYYGRSLRQGGGAEVAREFANFYLKTSNYSRAVRLLQFLLEVEDEKQPIYNNIGTALMYAGAPLDAETYLLIAQQMDPKDPVPYVNLGVLYERHLRKPGIAAEFYRCYLELTDGRGAQRERIQSRVSEMRPAEHGGRSDRALECGKPYRAGESGADGEPEKPDVDKKVEELETDLPEEVRETKQGKPIDLGLEPNPRETPSGDGPTGAFEGMGEESGSDREADSTSGDSAATETDGEAESEGPTIERAAESGTDRERQSSSDDDDASGEPDRAAVLEQARAAFEANNHEAVVDAISTLSLGQLNLDAMRIYGLSLAELGRNEDARQWLEWVVDRKPDPETVRTLLGVYERLERSGARARICRKFRERDAYQKATETCPSPVEEPDDEKLEKLRMQRERQNQ